MTIEQIKDLMDKEVITQVIDPAEIEKLSDEQIQDKFITLVGYPIDMAAEPAMVNEEPEATSEPEVINEPEVEEPVVEETEEE